MTWAERATDANQMRHSDLKGREGRTRAQLDKLWNDNSARSGVDWVALTFTQNHPHTHTTGSSKQLQHCRSCILDTVLTLESSLFLLFTVQVHYTVCLWGHNAQSTAMHSISVFFSFSFTTCGMMLLETKWILFMWAVLQWAWPWACPKPGSALLCSALAWPQSAFLSHAAPDLLTHFLTQEIELTPQPGPWVPQAHTQLSISLAKSSQTWLASAPLQLNQRLKREAGDFLWSVYGERLYMVAWRVLVPLQFQ